MLAALHLRLLGGDEDQIDQYAVARTENFGVFLFCGLLPWMAVQEGLLRSSTAITDNASLVKKLRFPSRSWCCR
jgi:ABC-type polysaccharide/polyol phosphate export permease